MPSPPPLALTVFVTASTDQKPLSGHLSELSENQRSFLMGGGGGGGRAPPPPPVQQYSGGQTQLQPPGIPAQVSDPCRPLPDISVQVSDLTRVLTRPV